MVEKGTGHPAAAQGGTAEPERPAAAAPEGSGAEGVKAAPLGSARRTLKVVLVALALLLTCAAILKAHKAYGVWVFSAIAAVLFVLGLFRKEKPPEEGSGSGPAGTAMATEAEPPVNRGLPEVGVDEGYNGKVLLVQVNAGAFVQTILRSGGRWHRDILRACAAEVRSLGLPEASLLALGGAHLRFQEDGSLLLWGRSEEFGRCNFREVVRLLKKRWPQRKITCVGGEG